MEKKIKWKSLRVNPSWHGLFRPNSEKKICFNPLPNSPILATYIMYYHNQISKLTDFLFFPFAPGTGPLLADEEVGRGICWGRKDWDGPPKDWEGPAGLIFCFLRVAETDGLGNGSWTAWPVFTIPGWSPLDCLHSLLSSHFNSQKTSSFFMKWNGRVY